MLRIIKWVLLALVVVLLGGIVADKTNIAQRTQDLVGVNAATAGAIPNPDWETINPFGCRYRFNLSAEEFADMQTQQLTQGNGWEKATAGGELYYPSLNDILTNNTVIFLNNELPNRVRWVVFNPDAELLYLGYFAH